MDKSAGEKNNINEKNNNLSNDKINKIDKSKYIYNNINIANKKIKVYKKEKINNSSNNNNKNSINKNNKNKFDLIRMPNNSYLYKKIQALIVKVDKANKFIN